MRLQSDFNTLAEQVFQSTHPVRGATFACRVGERLVEISIHAPREGCDVPAQVLADVVLISIHAPREGCDEPVRHWIIIIPLFQSTHPVRGATWDGKTSTGAQMISIHAPREGCDHIQAIIKPEPLDFNPRTP